MMDACGDASNDGAVFMTSSQVGKTLIMQTVVGYYIDQDPSPMLFVQPTLEMAEAFSKERIALMVRDTDTLRDKVKDPKARNSGNTILQKAFPGGQLSLVGANSPAGLASRPIRIVLLDEVDRYEASAATEGDPVKLATARTKTFWNRRIIMASTPGDAVTSRINLAWLESDQRHFWVPCAHCGEHQILAWEQVKWTDGDPATARYACENETCAVLWDDGDRMNAIRDGEWRAEFPERSLAGFHLNELYSPFVRLSEVVKNFLSSKDSPELLKVFVNTSLGEPWEEKEGETVDPESLELRREPYGVIDDKTGVERLIVPLGVVYVLLIVDVQDDRLEIEFQGYGLEEESWGLRYKVLRGDPGSGELWDRLEDEMATTFKRADGATLHVSATGIDSGGHYTSEVYAFCKKHRSQAYAIKGKGKGAPGAPLVEISKRPMKNHGIKLYVMNAHAAKDLIVLSRLKVAKPGPRFIHIPQSYPDDYFPMLTAEARRVVYSKGKRTYVWVKKQGARNEALDLRTMGLALLHVQAPNFAALADRIKPNPESRQPTGLRPVSIRPGTR
jgi:phage terminase large subunit GpA-like protein